MDADDERDEKDLDARSGDDRPAPSRVLRVANLTQNVTPGHLEEIFAHYGRVRAAHRPPTRAPPPRERRPSRRPQRPRRRPRRVRRPRRRRRRPPAHARRRYRRHHRRHHLRGRARPSRGTTRPHTPSNPAWTRARRRCPSRIQPPRLFQSRASPRAPRTRRRRRRSPPDLHARARTRTPRRRGERRSVASARRVDPGGCVATSDANARRGPRWTPPSGR